MTIVFVAVGGAIGAVLRDLAARRRGAIAGVDLVNRVGAVLLGVVVAAADAGAVGSSVAALLGIGLAGGMTTFSTWMVQIVDAVDNAGWARLVRETVVGLALAALALVVARAVLG